MANTANYDWPLPSPKGNQMEEVAKIATSFTEIDAKIKAFETSFSNHKHKFTDLEETPTTLGGYGITDALSSKTGGEITGNVSVKGILGVASTGASSPAVIRYYDANMVRRVSIYWDPTNETFFVVHQDSAGNPIRSWAFNPDGRIVGVTTPTGNNDAANKKYVDDQDKLSVRIDAAQEFTLAQKKRARDNIEAVGAVDKGAAGGVAPLGADGKIASTYLPALTTTATVGAAMAGANGKATPDDGDFFGGVLAGASTMFKITWANIKAALAAIFVSKAGDTLTGSLGGVSVSGARSSFWGNAEGGAYASMWTRGAPFYSSVSLSGSSYAPVIAEKYGNPGWGGIWSAGVLNYSNGAAAGFAIHHLNSSGNENVAFEFRVDGTLRMPGAVYRGGASAVYNDSGTYSIHISGSSGYAAGAGNADTLDGYHAQSLRDEAYAFGYNRTRDYLLAEHVPVGGYVLAQSLTPVGAGGTIAGTSLRWASAGGGSSAGSNAITYGTWQASGQAGSNGGSNNIPLATTLFKRIG